ncbi:MAG: CpsD/CapB family tyrosine-protein kinase [Clostridia bacterium]|nr:CpsD/CapB family tyrosine-protein kinase [Clostridia bacterium]
MNKELITYRDIKSPVSEMFKSLRTNIQFMNSDKQLKTLLVSSTLPGEGKSWTAANLAVTFAQAGKKVLLIDADMRKGRQFNIFGVKPTPGLSNYLSGVSENDIQKYELSDYIQKTDIDNLFVMTAGNVPPNPSELLVSEKMLELNDLIRQEFDITIFDGTPSLLVTDATILARMVDSTIIVTAHNETKIDNVIKVKKTIESIGGRIAGVVVNKVPISSNKYESTYYYGSIMPSTDVVQTKKKNSNKKSHYNVTKSSDNLSYSVDNYDAPKFDRINEKTADASVSSTSYREVRNVSRTNAASFDTNTASTLDTTQEVLEKMNRYLREEKSKLKNGDIYD